MFKTEDGKNHVFTFVLVSSLFLLWGTCNGMIDVMDKHFQDLLPLTKAKKASGFIVMSIIGGAIMPKLMGHLGDVYNMSVSFLMPLGCFALIALYGFSWTKLSKSDAQVNFSTTKGH